MKADATEKNREISRISYGENTVSDRPALDIIPERNFFPYFFPLAGVF